jgi:DNA-binding transcriptional MerR regulator
MRSEHGRWLTTGAAAHLLTEITARQYGPGILRYYETTGRIRAKRTTTGIRLFREAAVRKLAERLHPIEAASQ